MMSSSRDFTVYAIKLQPNGESGFFDGCRDAEVIGTGWDPQQSCDTPEEIEQAHKQLDNNNNTSHNRTNNNGDLRHELRYIVKRMNDGSGDAPADYVWVNEGGEYAICKVTSECTTYHDVDASLQGKLTNENGTRITNIRHVEWTDIPVEFVPGYVKRKFTGRFGTLNEIKKGVDEDAKRVVEQLHSIEDLDAERTFDLAALKSTLATLDTGRVFNTLDPDDTEELVLDYLQADGWRITKYSTGDSQAAYECELRRVSDDGSRQTGFVQVKSGNASVDVNNYATLANQGQVFLFESPDGDGQHRLESDRDGITVIDPDDLVSHLRENTEWLPTPSLLRLSFAA